MNFSPQTDTLLIARRRGFWETSMAHSLFPNHIFLPPAPPKINYLWYMVQVIERIIATHPRILILGTTMPLARGCAFLKRLGFLKNIRMYTDHQFLPQKDVRAFDALWVYSREEIQRYPENIRDTFVFFHYPSKTQLVEVSSGREKYVFAGGNHKRDHESFLQAMEGLLYPGVLVTDRKISVPIPANCTVHGHLPLSEYLFIMGHSRCVVVPLQESNVPHGHCDISAALSMGKAVITTRGASADDYIEESVDGILISPGDVDGYRKAIQTLCTDDGLLYRLEKGAILKAAQLSYETFAQRLLNLIQTK